MTKRFCACIVTLLLSTTITSGCSQTPVTPTPTPTPSPSPGTQPFALNTVQLAAPPAPARSAANPLVGRYQLDIVAEARTGTSCGSVPSYATRRTYTADIDEAGAYCSVKLYDARFLSDAQHVSYGCRDSRLPQSGNAVCHQFLLSGNVDAINLTLQAEDDWRGTEIWESLPDGFLLATVGKATGALRDGRIEAIGTGSLWYGNGLPATQFFACQSGDLRFTFTPK